jgi:glycosyltransferase involved in cell wall biosynthesis
MDRALGTDLDVFWLPANNAGAVSGDVPLVLTVHDLSFAFRPGDFTASDRLNHRLTRPRRQAEAAERILVTTNAVRRDVVGVWSIDPDRVDVVTPGIRRPAWHAGADATLGPPAEAVAAARARHGIPERYVLQVGALEPRKRPDALVHAMERADIGVDVVLVGAGRLAPTLHRPGVHLTGWMAEGELDLMYAGALGLVYPSMLEGYGFPPQEAALCGTPAIVSDLPALREALGPDGARYVTSGDERALADALRELADDEELRTRLARAAYAVAEPRTWEAAARGVLATLTRAAA